MNTSPTITLELNGAEILFLLYALEISFTRRPRLQDKDSVKRIHSRIVQEAAKCDGFSARDKDVFMSRQRDLEELDRETPAANPDPDTISRDPEPMPDSGGGDPWREEANKVRDLRKKQAEEMQKALVLDVTHDPKIPVWSFQQGSGKIILSDSWEEITGRWFASPWGRRFKSFSMRRSEFDALQDYQPS